jgi:N-acetyl-S-(2-succino)cysteine monooxygenase
VHLLASLAAHGWHPMAWRVSGRSGFSGAAPFRAATLAAERGGLDAVLFGLPTMPASARSASTVDGLHLDPLPLLGAMIGLTTRIGLCAYWPCDVAEPYHVARVFATLDHLSGGRIGWITGLAGREELRDRFKSAALPLAEGGPEARAVELIDVARQLWDSWEDRAFAVDQASGTFAVSEAVHPIEHQGRFFTVRGPLNVPRPIQGQPVVICRDGDSDGIAASSEIILSESMTATEAERKRARWQKRAADQGRAAEAIRLVARVMPILSDTEEAAKARALELDCLASPETVMAGLPRFIGTPSQFAAWMADWKNQNACDGFDILPAVTNIDLEIFVDEVVPELRRMGLRPTEEGAGTLREQLGLVRPASRYQV